MEATTIRIADYLELDDEEIVSLKDLIAEDVDFTFIPHSGGEYRLIHTDVIEEVFHDECKQTIEDCYDMGDVPSFVEIDWKATTDNCLVDGYGHQFSPYDGSEEHIGSYYIFRTS